jgi:hypothetical protein
MKDQEFLAESKTPIRYWKYKHLIISILPYTFSLSFIYGEPPRTNHIHLQPIRRLKLVVTGAICSSPPSFLASSLYRSTLPTAPDTSGEFNCLPLAVRLSLFCIKPISVFNLKISQATDDLLSQSANKTHPG